MKWSVRWPKGLAVVGGVLLSLAGVAAAEVAGGDGAAVEQARQNRQLYEQKRQEFEELFNRLDERDGPLKTEGSPEWLAAYGQLLSTTEEVMALCRGVAGCMQDEKQGEMYRKILVIGYADRAYVHIYGNGDRQAGLADVNRMAELDRNDTDAPRIIFWRGVISVSHGYFDQGRQELETLREQGDEAAELAKQLEQILADKEKAAGR